MDETLLIPIFAGVAVLTLIGGLGFVMTKSAASLAEQRLDDLAGKARGKSDPNSGILLRPSAIDVAKEDFWARLLPNPENLNRLYEQADVNMSFNRFMGIVVLLAITGLIVGVVLGIPWILVPLGGA